MKNSLLTKIVIVMAGLFFAVMVGYPTTMLVLGSMALPNIIVGVIFGSFLLYIDAFIVWMYITE